MRLFPIVFLLVYSLMHTYAFFKAKAALSLKFKAHIPLIVFMLIMILTPFTVYFSERHGYELFARVMACTGYLWMGAMLLFTCSALLFDVYRIIIYLIALMSRKDFSGMLPSAGLSFFIPLTLSLVISFYGYFEAKNIRTEHITIKTSKLPDNISSLKIVQISDVHLGLIIRDRRLRNIVDKVKEANPDILVSTGDLVDGQINRLEGLAEILNEVTPKFGKFAITGNHEFYAGLNQSLDFTRKAGFRILRGEWINVEGIINIAGVDDITGKTYGLSADVPEKELLSGLDQKKFTVLLKHRPLVDKDAVGFFDLQLSGHAHKGQIFPFSLITRIYYPADYGILNLMNGSYLYVSRGTGTWGPPIRFLSPPEVTVIELVGDAT